MIVLTIPEATPSGNKYAYSHWGVRFADKKRWAKMLLAAIWSGSVAGNTVAADKRKRRVTFERYGVRKLDVDNYASGIKGALDLLTEMQLIVDDSEEWLELVLRQPDRAKGEPVRTVITIEDMPRGEK